jgi:hypothetical protein
MAARGDRGAIRILRDGSGALSSYDQETGSQQWQSYPSVSHLHVLPGSISSCPTLHETRRLAKGCVGL